MNASELRADLAPQGSLLGPEGRAYGSGDEAVSVLGMDLDDSTSVPVRRRVLIIDDDPEMVKLLKLTVRSAGMDVAGAIDADEALVKCKRHPPDIMLLDLMMPIVDGWETLKRLREFTSAPVVVVSAKATKEEVVEGLDTGADDYITKPFYPPELVSRINAILRRTDPLRPEEVINFPDVQLSLEIPFQQVKFRGRSIDLTEKEFAVLEVLARFAPKPVRHETIAIEVWGEYEPRIRQRIKWTVHNLRRKLNQDSSDIELIETRAGFGYQLGFSQGSEGGLTGLA